MNPRIVLVFVFCVMLCLEWFTQSFLREIEEPTSECQCLN